MPTKEVSENSEAAAALGLFSLSSKNGQAHSGQEKSSISAQAVGKMLKDEKPTVSRKIVEEMPGSANSGRSNPGVSSPKSASSNDQNSDDDTASNKDATSDVPCHPRPNDILSGRGNGANQHTGNIYFRNLISSYKRKYVLSEPVIKKQITHQVLSVIQSRDPPGRFLKQDPNTGTWKELDGDTALRKTAQALREKAPQLKKKVLEEAERKDQLVDALKRKNFDQNFDQQMRDDGANKKHKKPFQQQQQQPQSASFVMRGSNHQHHLMKQQLSSLSNGGIHNHHSLSGHHNGAGPNHSILQSDGQFILQHQGQLQGGSPQQQQAHITTMPGGISAYQNLQSGSSMHPQHAPINPLSLLSMTNQGLVLTNDLLQSNNLISALESAQHSSENGSFLRQSQQGMPKGLAEDTLVQQQQQFQQTPGIMAYSLNYKTMAIAMKTEGSTKDNKKSTKAAKKAQDISMARSSEMLENIIMIASTSVDLTALFLIVSMSAQAFNRPSFSKHGNKPETNDVVINAPNMPNHPGNFMLAEAIQTYRHDYLQSGYSIQMKYELVQILLSNILSKHEKKNVARNQKPIRFLTCERIGNNIEWNILPEKEIFLLVMSLFEQACSYILNPDTNDVLFGCDGRSKLSPGNIFFKSIIRRCKPLFRQSPADKKKQYATEIVGFMTSRPGRFLGYVEDTGMWIPLTFDSAIEETQEHLDDNSDGLIHLQDNQVNASPVLTRPTSGATNLILQDNGAQYITGSIPQAQLYGNMGNSLSALTAAGMGNPSLSLQGHLHIDSTRSSAYS